MTISEETRHQLRQRLDDVLGVDEAATLMAHLPPVGWADVATKRDLDHAVVELRGELHLGLAGVRTELGGQIAELHREIGEVKAELHKEIGEVKVELHKEIGGIQRQLQGLFFKLAALQVTTVGVAVAAAAVAVG